MERQIVIVAPTYNEAKNITPFINAVLKNPSVKLVVSDSHSSDQTPKLVRKFKSRVYYLDVKKRGLGLGLYKGIEYAFSKLNADAVITMEADLSNDPNAIPQFISKLKTADLVLGSRYIAGGKIENWSWWRKNISRAANLVLKLTINSKVHEHTNLYRAFSKKTWQQLEPKLRNHPGWLFVPQFAFEALNTSLKIVELPITYFDRFGGKSKMNTVSFGKALMIEAIRQRLIKSASFFKFLVVGTIGFIINTTGLLIGVHFGMSPANAGAAGAEFAIISNFILNNLWTFSDRSLMSWKEIPWKFIQFNFLSLGSIVIQYISLRIGESIFGLSAYKSAIIDLPYIRLISWYMIFYVGGVGLGLIWNYFMYSRVIWAKKKK